MREIHRIQSTLTEPWLDLPHAKELKAISDLIDQHTMAGALVAQDISRGKAKRCAGLTSEQALRAMFIKQMNSTCCRQARLDLRGAHRHHRQGASRNPVRTQGYADRGRFLHDPRLRDRQGKSG